LPAPFEGWAEQKTVTIAGRTLGGLPGVNPMWLVASIFYMGDKHLKSEAGDFDREAVRKSVEDAVSIADRYGLVFALDVIFPSLESVEKILPFMAEFNIPLFLDSPDPQARARSYLMARELGLQDKVIANGIYVDSSGEELKALRESGIKTAVVMAFDPRNPYESMPPESRIRLLEEKLLPMAREAGVENVVVDAIVIDPASIAISAETIMLVKKRYGLPAGCAPANALGPVSKKAVGVEGMIAVHGTAAVLLRVLGADYVMYGPIGRIKYIAQSVAVADSLLGYMHRREGVRLPAGHPLRRFWREVQKLFASTS
jgi:tetrahydromethanopterin S-methyltransferase subunit H